MYTIVYVCVYAFTQQCVQIWGTLIWIIYSLIAVRFLFVLFWNLNVKLNTQYTSNALCVLLINQKYMSIESMEDCIKINHNNVPKCNVFIPNHTEFTNLIIVYHMNIYGFWGYIVVEDNFKMSSCQQSKLLYIRIYIIFTARPIS